MSAETRPRRKRRRAEYDADYHPLDIYIDPDESDGIVPEAKASKIVQLSFKSPEAIQKLSELRAGQEALLLPKSSLNTDLTPHPPCHAETPAIPDEGRGEHRHQQRTTQNQSLRPLQAPGFIGTSRNHYPLPATISPLDLTLTFPHLGIPGAANHLATRLQQTSPATPTAQADLAQTRRHLLPSPILHGATTTQLPLSLRCLRCRVQRRGCDGARPTCGTCANLKHQVACDYDNKRDLSQQYREMMQKQAEDMRTKQSGGTARRGIDQTDNDTITVQLPQNMLSHHYGQAVAARETGADSNDDDGLEPGVWTHQHYVRHWRCIRAGVAPPDDGIYDKTTKMYAKHLEVGGSIADKWARETFDDLMVHWTDKDDFIVDAMGDDREKTGGWRGRMTGLVTQKKR